MAALGAGVDGWPNSMWMIDRPWLFSSWARTLTAMAWNGSISAGMLARNIPRHRGPVHDPQMAIVAAFGEVHGAAVVPHQQHLRPPAVAIDEWVLGHVL